VTFQPFLTQNMHLKSLNIHFTFKASPQVPTTFAFIKNNIHMKNFKGFTFLMLAVVFALAITSCGEDTAQIEICNNGIDDDSNGNTDCEDVACDCTGTRTLSGNITEDLTMYEDTIYILNGRVVVTNNAILTINAGTIIKGDGTTGENATCLVIDRNAKIKANGTAADPIIFTSTNDDIVQGQIVGTTLDEQDRGLWGGLIILGNAPVSEDGIYAADGALGLIEGIPTTANLFYGGSNASDNSGNLNYVSIRHSGIALGGDNEIQGLTLAGVGNGTIISHIEIIASNDDGVEIFGGTVNVSNIVIGWQFDDAYDIDQNYAGIITNSVGISGADTRSSDPATFELDGPEVGGINDGGQFTFTNGVFFNEASNDLYAIYMKSDGPKAILDNLMFVDYGTIPQVGYRTGIANVNDGTFVISDCTFDGALRIADQNGNDLDNASQNYIDLVASLNDVANNNQFSTTPATYPVNLSIFEGWTYSWEAFLKNK
jgi:hypothetical protein